MESFKKTEKNKALVYNKKGEYGRVTKKNAASVSAASKNVKTIAISARTAGATLVEDEVMNKTGLMVDVACTTQCSVFSE